MSRYATAMVPLALTLAMVASGCALLGAETRRVTMAQLFSGVYDPTVVEGVDVASFGVSFDGADTFCEASGSVPLRWTVDAVVPMQLWLDTFSPLTDVPDDAMPSLQHLVGFTQRRLRWSLGGSGDRPTWDAETTAAAQTVIDVALAECPDLPLVVTLPGRSERPPGWADMSDHEVTAHCEWMARSFQEGVAEYEIDHGRPPRHHMELDLPTAYYGESDFYGLITDDDGRPQVVPVPGGACDLG